MNCHTCFEILRFRVVRDSDVYSIEFFVRPDVRIEGSHSVCKLFVSFLCVYGYKKYIQVWFYKISDRCFLHNLSLINRLLTIVARGGYDPPTSWLWIMRSNQLSYLALIESGGKGNGLFWICKTKFFIPPLFPFWIVWWQYDLNANNGNSTM